MKQLLTIAKRLPSAFVALMLTLVAATPLLVVGNAAAYGQLTSRSITMTSSAIGTVTGGPTNTNGTGVTYIVAFTEPGGANQIKSVDIDFCSTTPLFGDSCASPPTGMSTTSASLSAQSGTSGWTLSAGTNGHLVVSGASFNTAGAISFTIGGITNPTNVGTAGTFYGRIYDYAAQANDYASVTSPGTVLNFGGVAMSTANNITINSKVFESLSFCVYQTSCTSGTGNAPVLTLGDPTTQALSTGSNYVNSNTNYSLSTNAVSGVSVVMRGDTLCRVAFASGNCVPAGGSYASSTIAPIGTTATALSSAGSNERFGMCVNNNNNTGPLTVASTYKDTVGNCNGITTGTYSGTSLFGFDDTASTGTNSTAGSTVMSSAGAISTSGTNQLVFGAEITPTTETGIYQATLNLVATATF